MVGICQVRAAIDTDIIPDTAVLIYDRIFYITTVANANFRNIFSGVIFDLAQRFVIIIAHYIATDDRRAVPDAGPYAYHAVLDPACIDDGSFRDNGFFKGGAADLCRRKHPCMAVNNSLIIEQVEWRKVECKRKVGFKE